MALKLEDMDFLVDEIDDATLSQVCESIESEHFVTEGMCDLSVTQMVQTYDKRIKHYCQPGKFFQFIFSVFI
jgi:hypothetical protein